MLKRPLCKRRPRKNQKNTEPLEIRGHHLFRAVCERRSENAAGELREAPRGALLQKMDLEVCDGRRDDSTLDHIWGACNYDTPHLDDARNSGLVTGNAPRFKK